MSTRVAIILAAVPVAMLAAAPSLGASGCSKERCVPRTGTWSVPPSPKMARQFEGDFKVIYKPKGKRVQTKYGVKSKYGNTVIDFWVWLPYRCANPDYPWDEQALEFSGPLTIDREGKGKQTISSPPNQPGYRMEEHKLSLQFKRKTFTGRVSGTLYRYDADDFCSTSGSFSGKWKNAEFYTPVVQSLARNGAVADSTRW